MKIIDTHTHFYPREWIDLMAKEESARAERSSARRTDTR